MSILFANNAVSTLASGISAGALSLTVQAGDGQKYPSPTGPDYYLCTLQDAANNIEIIKVTSRSSDTFTIERAQEGTTALVWIAGDFVELRPTAGTLSQYRQGVGDTVSNSAINISVGAADVHNIINITGSGSVVSLADAATMQQGYQIAIKNSSNGNISVTRSNLADTIDGVTAAVTIAPGGSGWFSVNQLENGYLSLYNSSAGARPVGSLYFSIDPTDPATALGYGTWTAIPGRFIVGAGDNGDGLSYTVSSTGGSKDAIVVSHSHGITDPGHTHTARHGANSNGSEGFDNANYSSNQPYVNSAVTGITVNSTGSSGSDKNLPPYFACYIWRRTA